MGIYDEDGELNSGLKGERNVLPPENDYKYNKYKYKPSYIETMALDVLKGAGNLFKAGLGTITDTTIPKSEYSTPRAFKEDISNVGDAIVTSGKAIRKGGRIVKGGLTDLSLSMGGVPDVVTPTKITTPNTTTVAPTANITTENKIPDVVKAVVDNRNNVIKSQDLSSKVNNILPSNDRLPIGNNYLRYSDNTGVDKVYRNDLPTSTVKTVTPDEIYLPDKTPQQEIAGIKVPNLTNALGTDFMKNAGPYAGLFNFINSAIPTIMEAGKRKGDVAREKATTEKLKSEADVRKSDWESKKIEDEIKNGGMTALRTGVSRLDEMTLREVFDLDNPDPKMRDIGIARLKKIYGYDGEETTPKATSSETSEATSATKIPTLDELLNEPTLKGKYDKKTLTEYYNKTYGGGK